MEIVIVNIAQKEDPDMTPRSAESDLGLHCLRISFLLDTRNK